MVRPDCDALHGPSTPRAICKYTEFPQFVKPHSKLFSLSLCLSVQKQGRQQTLAPWRQGTAEPAPPAPSLSGTPVGSHAMIFEPWGGLKSLVFCDQQIQQSDDLRLFALLKGTGVLALGERREPRR